MSRSSLPITASSGQWIFPARPARLSWPAAARAAAMSGDLDRTRNASLVRLGRSAQWSAKLYGPASATQARTRSSPLATLGA